MDGVDAKRPNNLEDQGDHVRLFFNLHCGFTTKQGKKQEFVKAKTLEKLRTYFTFVSVHPCKDVLH